MAPWATCSVGGGGGEESWRFLLMNKCKYSLLHDHLQLCTCTCYLCLSENLSDHTHTQSVVLFVDYLLSICVHTQTSTSVLYIHFLLYNHSQALYQVGP